MAPKKFTTNWWVIPPGFSTLTAHQKSQQCSYCILRWNLCKAKGLENTYQDGKDFDRLRPDKCSYGFTWSTRSTKKETEKNWMEDVHFNIYMDCCLVDNHLLTWKIKPSVGEVETGWEEQTRVIFNKIDKIWHQEEGKRKEGRKKERSILSECNDKVMMKLFFLLPRRQNERAGQDPPSLHQSFFSFLDDQKSRKPR